MTMTPQVMDAKEWRGKESSRSLELHLTTKGTLEVFTAGGHHLRTVKLALMQAVNVKLSANKKRNVLLLQVRAVTLFIMKKSVAGHFYSQLMKTIRFVYQKLKEAQTLMYGEIVYNITELLCMAS